MAVSYQYEVSVTTFNLLWMFTTQLFIYEVVKLKLWTHVTFADYIYIYIYIYINVDYVNNILKG